MIAAVPQFLVIDIGLLVFLPGFLLDNGDFLALLLGSLDFLLQFRDNVHVHMEIVVQMLGNEVIDE